MSTEEEVKRLKKELRERDRQIESLHDIGPNLALAVEDDLRQLRHTISRQKQELEKRDERIQVLEARLSKRQNDLVEVISRQAQETADREAAATT